MDNSKSYIDHAYEVLLNRFKEKKNTSVPMPFNELLDKVAHLTSSSEDEKAANMSRFYTALTVDGRFAIKENNTWVLKEKEIYENVHIDMNEVYSDVENEEKELLSDDDNIETNSGKEFTDEEEIIDDDNVISANISDDDLEEDE